MGEEMKKLSKERLLYWVGSKINIINIKEGIVPTDEETQAYRQICQIINFHFDDDWQIVKKELGKFMQKQKPTVTEEFVQEAIDYIADFPSYKRLEKKLNEAGVEVVGK